MPRSNKTCCVVGCRNTYNNSPGTRFYRFPTRDYELDRRERWIALVRRKNPDGSIWRPGPSARICSRHFVGNEKSNIEKHPAYNPSIFPSHYRYTPPTHAVDRFDRNWKRTQRKADIEAAKKAALQSDDSHDCVMDRPVSGSSVEKVAVQLDDSHDGKADRPVSCSSTEKAALQSDDSHDCGADDLVSWTSEASSTEDEPRSIDVSTMTDPVDVSFSADFTFVSETSNGHASSFVRHREVRTTGLGSTPHKGLLGKSSGQVCK